MKITVTDTPENADEAFVINSLWQHNAKITPVDIHPLFLTLRDENQQIFAGLVARTWWGGWKCSICGSAMPAGVKVWGVT
ncbi:hypothetical protein ERHA54_07840 [Erwinia rhapontici]|uniref:Acetyltransferase (GNAT) family protein n=1 Tax=Erwinia rhapontici TaxID=55212 RepID=A0ABM7MW51_ERWRD|nr:hypothetical protein ERHA53_07400 [Erwinia rhapontici]BCQ38181.1 hypothetical protein ERHA54_07840 [Erwinia rhapontici]BCQ43289.1 hypothetical protein ERHA55_08160 [Erwinia rhapontici]